jgi:hypothetical protein
MIAALKKLFASPEPSPRDAEIARLQAEIATLSAEWAEAVQQHRHRAKIAARLQERRHELMKVQRGF